jgi:DNA-binding CsgD family transcriptional regulator
LWGSVFLVASAYSLMLFFKDTRWQLFYWIHAAWLFSLVLIILTVLITALVSAGRKGADQNSLRPFARLFLAGYAAFALSYLDYYFFHTGLQKYYDPVVLLLINLCPLLWLKLFFEKQYKNTAAGNIANNLSNFCEKFGISKREQEIIIQVMQGKSNKDIEKILFISHNTVKNHLYSVYQKAGVKSRSELIHHISETGL